MAGQKEDLPTPDPSPDRESPGRVHIYGGGIAGLTAAHELARRGFRVWLYEPAREYDETGHPERAPALGGLARSQFMHAGKGALGNFPRQGTFTSSDRYQLHYPFTPGLPPNEEGELENQSLVHNFIAWCGYFRNQGPSPGIMHIRVPRTPGFDVLGSPGNQRYSQRRDQAYRVKEYLQRAITSDERPSPYLTLERVIVVDDQEENFAEAMGEPFPPLEDKDELTLEVLHFLPGEHGFRFFPSYYRHLFSTLVETPILDDQGRPTGRRVFDNLVPSSFYGIAAKGRRIRFLRRAPSTRPFEMLQDLMDLGSSGYPATDMLQFTLRIWRYMSTCSERRKADFEGISWWEYLEGYEPKTGMRRYKYSEDFRRDMQFAPRVLAAFDGTWGDARTNGNTLAQLYLNNVLPLPKTDGTLNGPTTSAWFRPWRRYLESLGVVFSDSRLTRFELDGEGRLVAWVRPQGADTDEQDSVGQDYFGGEERVDYYVVATDAVAAEAVTAGLPTIGVIEKLRGFTTTIPANPRGPEQQQPRSASVLPGQVPWDRFQTLTGIQFFFPSSVRLAEGYLYFLDAPWGLSAINSHQYWATPPSLGQDGFGAVLSVDIGNWYVHEEGVPSPSDCSRYELAQEVWRQIRQATEQHQAPLPQARQFAFTLPEPAWYHLDRYIRFAPDDSGQEHPAENCAPYLIPIVGDWDSRPGTEPWDPLGAETVVPSDQRVPAGLWQAPHGGYPVHWDQLVFAGTYLKTFTRMTTMESANESARHAVNAILDHYLTFRQQPSEPLLRGGVGIESVPAVPEYSGQGTLTGSPEFRMTPIGEYCRIWDPEKYELPELMPLRELDAKLYASGLPHVWDVLRLEPVALPLLASLPPSGGDEALKAFLQQVRELLGALLKPLQPQPGA
ncbi:NAD(P)-binding protein [Pyxidicoccus parkwayensis]|uniref:NAD(P)-binding protein n=1 Tax=Pyxidicoccus parkwayensis TaxID=2813578 RepID=A0ABX7NY91_9BACT|nr:NAD(P)-binding protein [Pyxidicoccus parkwaysis]QSQ23443.1 NAD(P)-binding protein [Pyxidicoccus parkwaysis]